MSNAPARVGYTPIEHCAVERRTFRDDALQTELEVRGYVVVPLLGPDEVASLRERYALAADSPDGVNPPGAYNDVYGEFSIIHSRPDFRRTAFELIDAVVVPRTADVLDDHCPIIANFVNKPPGTGVVPTHQNFSVVDETRFRSVSVWVALVDCTVGNGAMYLLDGSHRLLRGRRGMWAYQAFGSIDEAVLTEHLTPIEIPAGHAIILDDALVHYSPPNSSTERRLAIQLVMIPADAEPIWFEQVGDDGQGGAEVDVWRIDDEAFFYDFWHGAGDTEHATRLDHVSMQLPSLDADAFDQLVADLRPPTEVSDEPGSARRSLRTRVARWRSRGSW